MESKKKILLLPSESRMLQTLGENIKLARLRRRLTADQVAERSRIGRMTLFYIEKGSPSVSIGFYFKVLCVLGLSNDILKIASDDELGRNLQDAGLLVKKRVKSRKL
jgi:transcriptional regulator with XRE-family HTH domain